MDLNETKKKPFYCIVIVQKNRVHLCGWSMQSYSNAFVFSSDTTVLYSVELLPWLLSFDAVWNWPRASWTVVVADE